MKIKKRYCYVIQGKLPNGDCKRVRFLTGVGDKRKALPIFLGSKNGKQFVSAKIIKKIDRELRHAPYGSIISRGIKW